MTVKMVKFRPHAVNTALEPELFRLTYGSVFNGLLDFCTLLYIGGSHIVCLVRVCKEKDPVQRADLLHMPPQRDAGLTLVSR